MSKNNNFKTIEEALQAVLDKKPLQYDTLIGSMNIDSTESTQSVLESIRQLHWSNFRVKPKTKILKYQTRLCKTSSSILIWDSLGGASQEYYETHLPALEWLEPTKEHVCEYEED